MERMSRSSRPPRSRRGSSPERRVAPAHGFGHLCSIPRALPERWSTRVTGASWITFLVITGFVWGGFALALRKGFKSESLKD